MGLFRMLPNYRNAVSGARFLTGGVFECDIDEQCHTQTHPQLGTGHHWQHGEAVLSCVLAAEHHTAEQYSKTGRTKPGKDLSKSELSWNTRQDFLKIPSLWEVAQETKRRCFSNVILETNVTPNITRSSDSFSTVLPIVNRGVAVMCMLHKIRCNMMNPLNDDLPGPYVPVRVTRGALVSHRYTYAPAGCRTSQYRRTFVPLSVSLWNDLADPVFDGVWLEGFKSRVNVFILAKAAVSLL